MPKLTMAEVKERSRLVMHWADGAELQARPKNATNGSRWEDLPVIDDDAYAPDFNVRSVEYRVKPSVDVFPGEVYMVKDGGKKWVPRTAATTEMFHTTKEDENHPGLKEWRYIRKATAEEVAEYYSEWNRIDYPGEWPDCDPGDRIEIFFEDGSIMPCNAGHVTWCSDDEEPIFWRPKKA